MLDAALRVQLGRLAVAGDHVDALDDDLGLPSAATWITSPVLALVLAGQDDDLVTLRILA